MVGSLYSTEAMCARNEKFRPSNVRCDTKTVNLHNDIASIAGHDSDCTTDYSFIIAFHTTRWRKETAIRVWHSFPSSRAMPLHISLPQKASGSMLTRRG